MEAPHRLSLPGILRAVSEGTPTPILLACDGGYAAQLATCLRSLAESNTDRWPLDIHVLVEKFPVRLRRRVVNSLPSGSASVRWIDADGRRFAGLSTMPHVSRMTFARLLIPDVMPADTARVLYLDADILVLKGLLPLCASDLGDCPVGAVVDPVDARIKANPATLPAVPRVKSYFNAGILLIDLQRWREKRISEKALEYLKLFPFTPYSDQDALNVACDGHWKALDAHWNHQGHRTTRIADLSESQRPAILHFVSRDKPWKPESFSLNAVLYDSFRQRTLFARTRLQIARDALASRWHQVFRSARQT